MPGHSCAAGARRAASRGGRSTPQTNRACRGRAHPPRRPGAQARHAPGLAQQAVAGQQFLAHAQLLALVVEHEDHAVLAIDVLAARRHQALDAVGAAAHRDWQAARLALALQGIEHALALGRHGPHAQLQRGAAHDLRARQADQALEGRVDIQIPAIGQQRDASGVGQGAVDDGVLDLGGAQGLAQLALLGDVQHHAGQAQHPAPGIALGDVAACEHPAPAPQVVEHPELGLYRGLVAGQDAAQIGAQAAPVLGVVALAAPAPARPAAQAQACQGAAAVIGGVAQAKAPVQPASVAKLLPAHVPLPASTAGGAQGADQVVLAPVQRQQRARAAAQQRHAAAQHHNPQRLAATAFQGGRGAVPKRSRPGQQQRQECRQGQYAQPHRHAADAVQRQPAQRAQQGAGSSQQAGQRPIDPGHESQAGQGHQHRRRAAPEAPQEGCRGHQRGVDRANAQRHRLRIGGQHQRGCAAQRAQQQARAACRLRQLRLGQQGHQADDQHIQRAGQGQGAVHRRRPSKPVDSMVPQMMMAPQPTIHGVTCSPRNSAP